MGWGQTPFHKLDGRGALKQERGEYSLRVECTFCADEDSLIAIPMDFRRYFISFIKTLLTDTPFFQRFEEEKPGYSPYVMGIKFAKVEGADVKRQELFVKAPVTLTFSTGIFNLMTTICNTAINRKDEFNILGLQLSKINLLPLKKIKANAVNFRIVGHAALRGEEDYLDASDLELLEEAINTHMQTKVTFLNRFYSELSEIRLNSITVMDNRKLFKGVCEHYGGKITTLKGQIILSGPSASLQFLYDYGLGVRTGQGFGLLEVIKQQ